MILKFSLLFTMMIAVSSTFAQTKLKLETRGDMESFTANKSSAKPHYLRFNLGLVRFDLQGQPQEDLSYRVRFRLSAPMVDSVDTTSGKPANSGRDSLNKAVDFAFLRHSFGDMQLTLGKQASFIGGAEGNTPSADLYLRSRYFSLSDDLRYASGISMSQKWGDQKFTFLVANPSQESRDDSGQNLEQRRLLAGLVYQGEFSEKTILPWFSYHRDNWQDGQTDYKQFATLGVTYNSGPFLARGDLHRITTREIFTDGKVDSTFQEWALSGAYRWSDYFQTEAKVTRGNLKDFSTTDTSASTAFSGSQLSFEYYPNATPNDFRYHFAISQTTAKLEDNDTKTEQLAVVGFRMNLDIIK